MKFHSIHLRNYRGIEDSRVEFGDGVTVVEGPNEVGKSSIHEAITHLREDKASSRKASVKETQPVGVDAGPEVELHLSTGDYELKYRKRWIKQPFTELSVIRPRPEQLSSDDAHDRYLAILAETVDVDLLDALDVAQGESLAQAPLAQIKALHSALNESGVEVADHDDFLDRIEVEYAKYFTKSGKETGDYKAANAEVPSAEAAFEELRERSRGMDELVDNHARAAARLESVRDQLTQAVTDRDQAEQAAKAVAELKAVLDQALEQAKSAQRDEQIAREALDRRTQLIEDVATAEETVTAARTSFTELETTQSDKDSDFDRAQKTLEEKQNALDEARALAKTAAKDVTKARARTELTELTRRLDTIRDHDEKRSRAQATIASIAVTAKNVEALISLETEVRIAENAKTSAAAQIVAKQLGSQSIDVDGTVLGDGATGEFAAVKDVRITIDGIADITVRPGASPVELGQSADLGEAEPSTLSCTVSTSTPWLRHARVHMCVRTPRPSRQRPIRLSQCSSETTSETRLKPHWPGHSRSSRPTEPTQTAAQTRAISTTSKQQSPRPRRAPRLLSLRWIPHVPSSNALARVEMTHE